MLKPLLYLRSYLSMTAEEIRQQLHSLIDTLSAEQLQEFQRKLDSRFSEEQEEDQHQKQRAQLLAQIIAEDTDLLKQLGR